MEFISDRDASYDSRRSGIPGNLSDAASHHDLDDRQVGLEARTHLAQNAVGGGVGRRRVRALVSKFCPDDNPLARRQILHSSRAIGPDFGEALLTDRDLTHLLGAYDVDAPLDKASTIPSDWYYEPMIARLERNQVFGRGWQVVGRKDQVDSPGKFFTIEMAGEPLVVVRGADDVLRGFFNVCRHHAAAVAIADAGATQLFRCPYHGWTYGLDGSLKGTPDFAGVCDFDRAANGLVPVHVATWESFVFVRLSAGGPHLEEFLGDLAARIAPRELSRLKFHSRRDYVLRCNWKVFVDNYLDGGYHVPYIHKGLNSVLEYSDYTIENGDHYCLQSSPLVDTVEKTRAGDRAYYYWLYPNFMINVYEGVMDTNLVLPIAPDLTRVIFDFYFDESKLASAAESIAISDLVQREDVGVCEAVQRGLGSRAYRAGRLSVRREAGEHLFHRLLARDLRTTAL